MKKRRPDGKHLAQEVQRWIRILPTITTEQREEFADWLRRSPQHVGALFDYAAVSTELRTLDAGHQVDVEALIADALSHNVIPLHGGSRPPQPEAAPTSAGAARTWRRLVSIAAAIVVVSSIAWIAIPRVFSPSRDYVTQTGELLRVPLPDGTVIQLNTQSHIRVDYTANRRDVTLLSGEALFAVRHDAARPFRVHIDKTLIEDLGTQFSVYRRPDATTSVAVLEGNVQVSYDLGERSWPQVPVPTTDTSNGQTLEPVLRPTRVDAGEAIRIVAQGQMVEREPKDASHAAAWVEHQLWFDGSSLAEIAAEFNRYNVRQIHVSNGAVVATKRYSGLFDAYDPNSFLQFVAQDPTIHVEDTERRVLIQDR